MATQERGILVHDNGRETHCSVSRLRDMQRSGCVQFAGRRDGRPVYVEDREVVWWNGHDVYKRDEFGLPINPCHKPGEVVS